MPLMLVIAGAFAAGGVFGACLWGEKVVIVTPREQTSTANSAGMEMPADDEI